jgi:large subunit ribosomal protein L24
MRVIPDKSQVIVKGLNMRTKHLKPTRINPQGGIITKEAPIHISNVSPVVDGKPTRVRFQTRDDGSKVRVAVKGGKVLGPVRGKA